MPTGGHAQGVTLAPRSNVSHCGVTGSFTPAWRISEVIADIIAEGDETIDIDCRECSIGIARGRLRGGVWGLSFVRKNFRKGSTSAEGRRTCYQAARPSWTGPGERRGPSDRDGHEHHR